MAAVGHRSARKIPALHHPLETAAFAHSDNVDKIDAFKNGSRKHVSGLDFFAGIRHNPLVDAAFKGMRPAVVALIIGPVLSLSRGMHPAMLLVIAATALLIWGLGWSPIYLLAAAAALGIAWELYIAKKAEK